MKNTSKIALLVACVLFLSLTACTLKASTPPATTPTTSGEVPFPFTTPGNVSTFGTQTAIAKTPVENTPQVTIATETPGPDSGGGQQPAEQATQAQQAQPPAAAPAANTPVIARPTSYVLQKGEWPICIARRYNLDLNSFFANNGLNMNSKPAAGATLRIPASGTWSANFGARSLKAHPASYTVVAGDTVNTIACKYGDVAPESILAVNNLSSASDVKSGMTLQIP